MGGGASRGMLPLLALHAASEYYRLPWKPPVTAALLTANVICYLRPAFLHHLIPSINEVWFNPYLILKHRDLKRFFLSAFYHLGESHLFYNMMSLLWKGVPLETSMGSAQFASMVAVLLTMSQGITLLLAQSLVLFFDYGRPFYSEYAAGFSGVLFAMKVVLNSQFEAYSYVHGVVVPTRYAAWAELIIIQLFVPGVSFLGHLGGILAGILYLKLRGLNSGSNPLTLIVDGIAGVLSFPARLAGRLFGNQRRRISGRGTTGRAQTGRRVSDVWRCQACTYDNSDILSECEMCGTSRSRPGLSYGRSSRNSGDLTHEEIRRRRLERFG
ncbi:hypothetical protein K2173_019080 [Erythroxylum novogranatense]|uniref:RanBP2-type domain-containing protein n=1 Tax=Erythroxylum novogranatense TaxID=1862640 RepID=A0AAV8SSN2_9ROSI|nr:hypothetical protein K2173_019080 [Erythroxylum novogranatense]